MTIILLANRLGAELWPISEHIPPALISAGGRTMIDHCIGHLAIRQAARIIVVTHSTDFQTKPHLRRQAWPGVKISIRQAAPERTTTRTLVIRGDMWRCPKRLDGALNALKDPEAPLICAPEHGLWVLEAGTRLPDWEDSARAILLRQPHFPDLMRDGLMSVRDLHRMCLDAAAERISGLEPGGWREPCGLRVGLDSSIETHLKVGKDVLVGARSQIQSHVALGNHTVIGDDCTIYAGVSTTNTVVLDRSHIDHDLTVRHAVVGGPWLVRVDTGVVLRMDQADCFSAATRAA